MPETRFDLPPRPLIVDVGAYKGDWARAMALIYEGARVIALEPVLEHFREIPKANGIEAWCFALGRSDGRRTISAAGDASSFFAGEPSRDVDTIGVGCFFGTYVGEDPVDLMKLNCEGAEFEILEAMVEGLASRVGKFLIQFHKLVPDPEARYEKIASGLDKTHELVQQTPWVWETWQRRR